MLPRAVRRTRALHQRFVFKAASAGPVAWLTRLRTKPTPRKSLFPSWSFCPDPFWLGAAFVSQSWGAASPINRPKEPTMTATNTLRAAALIPMIFASASALAWGIEPLRLPTAPTFVSQSFPPPPPAEVSTAPEWTTSR